MKARFGLLLPQGWRLELPRNWTARKQLELAIATAREAERSGFHAGWVSDHFQDLILQGPSSCFEPWALLGLIARETKSLRLGTLVTCNCYRSPALTARASAFVDVLSNGRLEFGIGAGWKRSEFEAFGFQFPTYRERVEMLSESLSAIETFWSGSKVTLHGKHYSFNGGNLYPRPVQSPRPPITIGGSGDPLLSLAIRHADRIHFPSNSVSTPAQVKQKCDRIDYLCKQIGRDPNSLEKGITKQVIIGDSQSNRPRQSFREQGGISPITGTPSDCIREFEHYLRAGITYFVVYFPYPFPLSAAAVRTFSAHIIKAFS